MKKFIFVQLSQEIFNADSSNWWENDITNSVGQELDSLTSLAGYSQIIDKPTHILNHCKVIVNMCNIFMS